MYTAIEFCYVQCDANGWWLRQIQDSTALRLSKPGRQIKINQITLQFDEICFFFMTNRAHRHIQWQKVSYICFFSSYHANKMPAVAARDILFNKYIYFTDLYTYYMHVYVYNGGYSHRVKVSLLFHTNVARQHLFSDIHVVCSSTRPIMD